MRQRAHRPGDQQKGGLTQGEHREAELSSHQPIPAQQQTTRGARYGDLMNRPEPSAASRDKLTDLVGTGQVRVVHANLHNLQNVDVELPRDCLVAFTGISGSGKSSLAFGTIHGEAQRRYFESVAPFARRLIGRAVDPQVERIDGLPPTVALQQSRTGGGARSSVGTITTLSNSIRLLYSRAGQYPDEVRAAHGGKLSSNIFSPNTTEGMCPQCHGLGVVHNATEASMVPDPLLSILDGAIASWPGAWLGKNFRDILRELGYPVDVPWRDLPQQDRDWILFTKETPTVTVRPVREAGRIQRNYEGQWISAAEYLLKTFRETQSAPARRRALSFLETAVCPLCHGRRLTADALTATYLGEPIDVLNALDLQHLGARLQARLAELPDGERTPAEEAEHLLLPAVIEVLRTVNGLGLGHLSLDRATSTLAAGELQRLRLASQLRSGLFGVVYVLDEPSAGLHAAEKHSLRELFARFVAGGNSVFLIEHDLGLVADADWIVDVGPAAGEGGGRVLYSGPVAGLSEIPESITARYLTAPAVPARGQVRAPSGWLGLNGVTVNNLRELSVCFPLGVVTVVSGVSGSGKTSLLRALATALGGDTADEDGEADATPDAEVHLGTVSGASSVNRVVAITQKPIGRTPRSTLATYTGLFDRVRKLFADTDEAKSLGFGVGRFSFNVAVGRCETCQGEGQIEVELVFLPGSYTPCPTCHGARYNPETLQVRWQGLTVADVLDLTVDEAVPVFAADDRVSRALTALTAVGLGYLRLGQPAPELSGGEAQRIKLATELQRAPRGHTVYLLDEPSTGLHPADVDLLLTELNRLVERGNTVVMVEHDLRVIAGADHVIDLGPGAGDRGGRVVASGSPAEVAAAAESVTGRYL